MAIQAAKSISPQQWERTLQCYKRELVLKVAALAIIGLANLVGIAYAGYRFYEIVPLSWTKAIVYTPLIAGLLLTVVVYKKILTGKAEMPNSFNEKTASIYNPLLILSSLLSFGLLLPFVAAISKTDLTNYAHKNSALATAHRLRHNSFREISPEEASHYSTLSRLGFIQEKDSSDNFIMLSDFETTQYEDLSLVTPTDKEIGVKEWIKKANRIMKDLEEELQEILLQTEGAKDDPRIKEKIDSLRTSIQLLNAIWKEKATSICPEYTGKIGGKRTWVEKTLLRTPREEQVKGDDEGEPDDGDDGDNGASSIPAPSHRLQHIHI